jgi:hypothetical protein
MANKLTNLITKELSFCKKGAVPNAKIDIFKSADPVSTDDNSVVDKVVEKVLAKLGNSIESAPVTKGLFMDNWNAKELKNSFYDIFWALDDTVWQIMNDEATTDKSAKIKEAITEFAVVAAANLPQDVQKHLEVRKSLVIPVRSQIEKAFIPVEKSNNEEGGKEDMNEEQIKKMTEDITKSVTEAVMAQFKEQAPVIVKSVVTEELKPVNEHVTKMNEIISKVAPSSQQPAGQETPVEKKDNFWEGIL